MKYFISIITIITILTSPVYAFRCKGEPIGRWDTKSKVLKYCGHPAETGLKKIFYNGTYIHAETWYYNCGFNDFIYAVTFIDEKIFKEEPLRRGFKKGQCN